MFPINSLRRSIICILSLLFSISNLILLSYSHNLPVIRSKDCTEIDWNSNGKQMLQIFKDQPVQPNIFQEFEYMDYREDWLISQRNMVRMYKQNYSNMGYYQGYGGYMAPQMNYMYPGGGYGGIPGVGYNRDYYEGNGEKKKPVMGYNSAKFEPKQEENKQEEEKI